MSDQSKPLSAAEIEELRELADLFAHAWDWTYSERAIVGNSLPRLLAMLTPPADAAVREAVMSPSAPKTEQEVMQATRTLDGVRCGSTILQNQWDALRTLLSHVRAAQAPRLTEERLEAVRFASNNAESEPLRSMAMLRAAFPELGEG